LPSKAACDDGRDVRPAAASDVDHPGRDPVAVYAEKLAQASGLSRETIKTVLIDEVRRGRVVVRDGRLELVPASFSAGTLEGLRQLTPGRSVDEGGIAAAARNGARLGWSARTIAAVLPRFPPAPAASRAKRPRPDEKRTTLRAARGG
jgi:hypothetical protein